MPPLSFRTRPLPPLTALRAFEAAIRHGRMTRAAEELGVTHGAISRQVRLLEDTFGMPLMTRSPGGLVPTEAGAALAQRLARGFREIEAGVDLLRADAGGVLDVSCLGTFTLRWLIPRLGRFATAHPGIEVRRHSLSVTVSTEPSTAWAMWPSLSNQVSKAS